ncbi:MAG: hypothetical protein DCC56_08000 [Anaerolineae bacterium]|nr:hypothetical protein [Anaerolineales bacterium]RIK30267.1 MAG: hypothetical protein DCC56_08000 [Anaerolineae bacterium]WKZ45472.1 MAG: hypothetical protein QY302_06735 [Anaerolineales bacterium]WKZ48088.1 MAG: hypothetical protein QY306_01810 [Anaerolineales bacterium]
MKIIKNDRLIKRNSRIGQWITIASLLILAGGMFFSISDPSDPQRVSYSLFALFAGFILTQIGLYMGNRWGRSPRPDEQLDAGLKGLPGEFNMYHYTTPASHLLVGPAGVWVLLPYRQKGAISFSKNRWRVSGGGFLQAYMSIFGQEGIGRPDLEAENEIRKVKKALSEQFGENEIPEVNAALVFTNEQVEINPEGAPISAMKPKQLKDYMRQKAKEKPISQTQLAAVKAALPQ